MLFIIFSLNDLSAEDDNRFVKIPESMVIGKINKKTAFPISVHSPENYFNDYIKRKLADISRLLKTRIVFLDKQDTKKGNIFAINGIFGQRHLEIAEMIFLLLKIKEKSYKWLEQNKKYILRSIKRFFYI